MAMTLTSCHLVPAGNVGIKFYLIGSDKGVEYDVLTPGRYAALNWNRKFYNFPTFTQNVVWTMDKLEGSPADEHIVFQSKQGLPCWANIGMTYHVDPSKVPLLFQTYKQGINEITNIFLRNMVRDAIVAESSQRTVEEIYGPGKMELIEGALNRVQQQVLPLGIIVEKIYWIGNVGLPEEVEKAISAKAEAMEKAEVRQNEIAEEIAKAQKKVEEARGTAESILINAKAQAESNIIIARSITPTLIDYMKMQRWDGVLPQVSGTGSIPVINLK
jgi:regulator of protease activity HflC (stomatin/prohibitin superfamily)